MARGAKSPYSGLRGVKRGGVIYDKQGKRMYGPEEAENDAASYFMGPEKNMTPQQKSNAHATGKRADAAFEKVGRGMCIAGPSSGYKEIARKRGILGAKMSKRNPLYGSWDDSIANSAD